MVAALFAMDVANASMYDGATALAEGVLMAVSIPKKKLRVVVSGTVHPHFREVLRTYTTGLPVEIVELPIPTAGEGGEERRQTAFMLHSMAHWQKTVHGYSGWRTDRSRDLFTAMQTFPDAASLASLSSLGVTYIVVHTDSYEPEDLPRIEKGLRMFASRLQLEHVEGAGRVYSLKPGAVP